MVFPPSYNEAQDLSRGEAKPTEYTRGIQFTSSDRASLKLPK